MSASPRDWHEQKLRNQPKVTHLKNSHFKLWAEKIPIRLLCALTTWPSSLSSPKEEVERSDQQQWNDTHRDPGLLWLPSQGKENQGSEMRSSLHKLREKENYPEIQGKPSDCSSPVLIASQLLVTGLSSGSTSIFVEIILERIFCFIKDTTFGDVAGRLRVAWIPLLKTL